MQDLIPRGSISTGTGIKGRLTFIIENDGIIYPIEIKKSGKPSLDMAKHFNVFHEIGKGCILCQCEKPYYLKDDVIALPIEYV